LGVSIITAVPVWYRWFEWMDKEVTLAGLITSIISFLIQFAILGIVLKVISADDWRQLKNWMMLKFFITQQLVLFLY
jgi:hypothetical protein